MPGVDGAGLDDKVCVVTGGGAGIGRATALEMARRGAKVVVSDVADAAGEETAALVAQAGGASAYLRCDVREAEQVEALMRGAAQRFGGIDVLHSNAGVFETAMTSETTIEALPLDVWDAVVEINLRGVWLCTQYAA